MALLVILGIQVFADSEKSINGSNEFTSLSPGQSVSPGFHVKINLETGEKLVRNIDLHENDAENGSLEEEISGAVILVDQESENSSDEATFAGRLSKEPNENISGIEFSNTWLKKLLYENHMENTEDVNEGVFSDLEVVARLFNNHSSPENKSLLEEALDSLKEIAHQSEVGMVIASNDNLQNLLFILSNSKNSSLRKAASQVIGSALYNNVDAHAELLPSSIIPSVLHAYDNEHNYYVKSSILYALAASLHGKASIRQFYYSDGGNILRRSFLQGGGSVRAKTATLIGDIFSPLLPETSDSKNSAMNNREPDESLIEAYFPDKRRYEIEMREWSRVLMLQMCNDTEDVSVKQLFLNTLM